MKKICEELKLIVKIFRTSHKFDYKITIYEILTGLCINLRIILNVIIPAHIVDLIVSKEEWKRVLIEAIFYGLIICILECGEKSFKLLQEAHGFKACNLFRLSMNQKFMKIDYQDTENKKVIDSFEKAKESMWEFTDVGYVILIDILGSLLTFICMSYIIINVNPLLYLIVLIMIFINTKIQYSKNELQHESEKQERIIERKMEYISNLMQDYSVGKEIRLFNLKNYFLNKLLEVGQRYKNQIKFKEIKILKLSFFQNVIYLIELLSIYISALIQYKNGNLKIGSFLIYTAAIIELTSCVQNLLDAIIELSKVSFYYKDYQKYMEIPEKMRIKGNVKTEDKTWKIEIENVSYTYPGSEKEAVNGISFSINENEKVAIVGENGSGKSTLIKLLLRLYEPTKGRILLNGIDIREYDYDSYLNIFSSVFQDFMIFSYSILENLVFDREIDKNKLEYLLKKVKLNDTINKYPNGINSMVGKELADDGVIMSGGEKQLIAFVRSLYKGSNTFTFDEPTAALDPIKEANIYRLINNMTTNHIAIFCSHRMSSTIFCDKIIVLKDGRMIEWGMHDELMEKKGIYYNMYENQANLYITK